MTAQIINGKAVAQSIQKEIQQAVRLRVERGLTQPGLAVIMLGSDPASAIYVRNKIQACETAGIRSFAYNLSKDTSETELLQLLAQLNKDAQVHGILVQLPLPPHLPTALILEKISPEKDVDGFHPYNMGRLALRQPIFRPCTPKGVMHLLDHINQAYKGIDAVIVGASNLVGRPMGLELLLAGATVTTAHRFTKDLQRHVERADILVVATGKPNLVKGEWIKYGATIIDVGFHRLQDGSFCGDVEFQPASKRAAWITPVPGGVGPMTVSSLLENTLLAAQGFD